MTTFFNRTTAEQELIRKAYDFEIEAIATDSTAPNPYKKAVKALGLWEAVEEALEMAFAEG